MTVRRKVGLQKTLTQDSKKLHVSYPVHFTDCRAARSCGWALSDSQAAFRYLGPACAGKIQPSLSCTSAACYVNNRNSFKGASYLCTSCCRSQCSPILPLMGNYSFAFRHIMKIQQSNTEIVIFVAKLHLSDRPLACFWNLQIGRGIQTCQVNSASDSCIAEDPLKIILCSPPVIFNALVQFLCFSNALYCGSKHLINSSH